MQRLVWELAGQVHVTPFGRQIHWNIFLPPRGQDDGLPEMARSEWLGCKKGNFLSAPP